MPDYNTVLESSSLISPLVAAFTGGLAGAFLNQLGTALRDRKQRAEETGSATLFIVQELRLFATRCVSVHEEHGGHESSGGIFGRIATSLPVLGEFPSWIRWPSIGADLAAKLMGLRAEISDRQAYLHEQMELVEREDVFDFTAEEALLLAQSAQRLIVLLTEQFKLPEVDRSAAERLSKYVSDHAPKVEQQQEKRRADGERRRIENQARKLTEEANSIQPITPPVASPTPPLPPPPTAPKRSRQRGPKKT